MYNLFFDTEFTGLHKNTTLISLGIVSEDGWKFYAEFSDYDENQCDDWIKDNVIKHLYIGAIGTSVDYATRSVRIHGSRQYVLRMLIDWLRQYDEIQLISDVCHYDFVLLIDLFGCAFDLPKNVNPACHDINQDIARHYGISEREAFDKSREEIVAELRSEPVNGRKHNALYDAEVIRSIYHSINKEEK